MTIKIDKGIKLPKEKNAGRKYKYPVLDLRKVGDSFFVENDGTANIKLQKKISAICLMRIKKSESKFKITVRQIQNPLGIRVWRIK